MLSNMVYWVWLCNLSGIFPNKITSLLEHFETAEDIYNAKASDYKGIAGISGGDALVLNSKDLTHAYKIIDKCEKCGAVILTFDDKNYPDCLRKIPNPPYVLYLKGEILPWDRLLSIGVVGTRHCSEYGSKATRHIVNELALNGVTVVSGMAHGIDTVAAWSALEAGGKTVAVLGSGIDVVYPPENERLMKNITENGAVITEYPPGSPPIGFHFPERNRIISGLSRGILVAEAPKTSGAIITARYAVETGKDLFVIPGQIFDFNYVGSNRLLKEAGKATICANDILEEYEYDLSKLVPPEKKSVNNVKAVSIDDDRYAELDEAEKQIISLLIDGNMHVDELSVKSGIDMERINSLLPILEIRGLIKKLPGDNYKLEY